MTFSGYQLADKTFRTKENIKQHIRLIRGATELRHPVTDTAVLALLRLHPEWHEKTSMMDFVGTALIKGTPFAPPRKEIAIINKDSSVMDISWSKLVGRLQKDGSLKHPTEFWEALAELKVAARQAVNNQLQPLACKGMHVDHVYPNTFDQLLFDWVVSTTLSPIDIKVQANDGPIIMRQIVNTELLEEWQEYHRSNAILELVTPLENLQRKRADIDWGRLQ
jgi:hypothetical protein